jgi:hypothetical protein
VDFEVLDDLSVNGTLVISKGELAFSTITGGAGSVRI